MNVLYIHGSHVVRGGDTVYLRQVTELAPQYGFNCILLSVEKTSGNYSVQIFQKGEPIYKKNIEEVKSFIAEVCVRHSIDLIHIHTIYLPEVTEHCLTLKPVLKSPHSTDIVCPGSYKFFTKTETICDIPFGAHCLVHTYTRRCCSRNPMKLAHLYNNVHSEVTNFSKRYRKIIVMSEYVRQECIQAGIDGDKIEVNHYFTPEAPVVSYSGNGKKNILFLGRLSVVKGLPYLLKAMKEVLFKRDDVELHIAGAGTQLVPSKHLAASLGIEPSVVFHGWQNREDIRSLLEGCYLVVVPSIYPEAFGIVGIEAMMCGKPVVGFDVGGISSWLKDQETGFLVANKNVHALAAGIEALVTDATLYNRMAENARRNAIARFAPAVHFKKLLKSYQSVIPQTV